ncbi:hypothetical protein DL95DRAFT_5117 [Leptodontidium sp. 2 PMI_412]|nr:hypothetical protein DL95DRAFT_5117 [Leptodontidium sp. 2 PMI_412]
MRCNATQGELMAFNHGPECRLGRCCVVLQGSLVLSLCGGWWGALAVVVQPSSGGRKRRSRPVPRSDKPTQLQYDRRGSNRARQWKFKNTSTRYSLFTSTQMIRFLSAKSTCSPLHTHTHTC